MIKIPPYAIIVRDLNFPDDPPRILVHGDFAYCQAYLQQQQAERGWMQDYLAPPARWAVSIEAVQTDRTMATAELRGSYTTRIITHDTYTVALVIDGFVHDSIHFPSRNLRRGELSIEDAYRLAYAEWKQDSPSLAEPEVK